MKTRSLTGEFLRKNVLMLVLAAAFGIASDVLSLFISSLLKGITDTVAEGRGTESIKALAWQTLFIMGGLLITGLAYYVFKSKFNKRAMTNYKERVMELITGKDIFAFKGESGSVYVSALTNDATAIETGYLDGILSLISQTVMFIGSLVLMLDASPMLTLITVGLLLIPIAVSLLTGKSLVKYEKETSERNASFVAGITEILRGFSVVKCFKSEKEVRTIVNESNKQLENTKCRKGIVKGIIGLIGNIAGASTQFGIFLIGAVLAVGSGNITAGTLMLFVNLMGNIIAPLSSMPSCIAGIKSAKALIKKMAEGLSEADDEGTLEIDSDDKCNIELKDVSFGYDEDKEVLHGIDAVFEKGKSYALVGGSGSGKSTILKLLMSSYDSYKGSISIDGKEIRDIKTSSLYDVMSMIEQEVFVFNNSIRENITMFRDFTKERIDSAISKAGLSALIEDKGEDYCCGENGSNLSGGERQRISIARSLLLGNEVLLVDEATAALDAETAFTVTNSILDLEGKTKIVVTHDLDAATLARFDKIITLKGGRIAESGTFEELMNRKEYFYSLFTIAQ